MFATRDNCTILGATEIYRSFIYPFITAADPEFPIGIYCKGTKGTGNLTSQNKKLNKSVNLIN